MKLDYSYYNARHVPAFVSWNWNNDLRHFTQSFESARQARFFPYRVPNHGRDLYVPGDLYEDHLVAPAMIVVPRCKARIPRVAPRTPKPIDEDLYKISPELLYAKPTKKIKLGIFSSCFVPTCVE